MSPILLFKTDIVNEAGKYKMLVICFQTFLTALLVILNILRLVKQESQ